MVPRGGIPIRTFAIAGLASVVVLALSSAGASHCVTYSTSTTSGEMLLIPLPFSPFSAEAGWIVIDVCQVRCRYSAAIYYDTNGIEGLQRWDNWVDDTCHGMIAPDQWDA